MLHVEGCCGSQSAITCRDQRHDDPAFVVQGPVGGAVHGGVTGAGKSGPLGDDLIPQDGLVRVEGEGGGREQEGVLTIVEGAEREPKGARRVALRRRRVVVLKGIAGMCLANCSSATRAGHTEKASAITVRWAMNGEEFGKRATG